MTDKICVKKILSRQTWKTAPITRSYRIQLQYKIALKTYKTTLKYRKVHTKTNKNVKKGKLKILVLNSATSEPNFVLEKQRFKDNKKKKKKTNRKSP